MDSISNDSNIKLLHVFKKKVIRLYSMLLVFFCIEKREHSFQSFSKIYIIQNVVCASKISQRLYVNGAGHAHYQTFFMKTMNRIYIYV